MQQVLIVYLKDTFYAGARDAGGVAQWHSKVGEDLREVILGSGALVVFRPDAEDGKPQAHLGGERGHQVAFFPAGGWSGYCWENIEEGAVSRAKAQAAGLAVPR